MFCLAVATEAPSDLKKPVSLSTSYRSLQPLRNSATSLVPALLTTQAECTHMFELLGSFDADIIPPHVQTAMQLRILHSTTVTVKRPGGRREGKGGGGWGALMACGMLC